MATRLVELELYARGQGVLAQARADEPLFILRAKDPAAADTVRAWARLSAERGVNPGAAAEAENMAVHMEWWRKGVYGA